MGKLIEGIHHVAIKPTAEKYEKTVDFYTKLLGLEVVRSWGDPKMPCLMVSCGDNSCMEILSGKEEVLIEGPLAHIAFATRQVDEVVEKVRKAGYEVTIEPKDVVLGDLPARIAFFRGPTGEIIEVFWEKQ